MWWQGLQLFPYLVLWQPSPQSILPLKFLRVKKEKKLRACLSQKTEILEDESINCVVELMGGVTHAKDVVFKALKKSKHVVTANKALLAQLLPEVRKGC